MESLIFLLAGIWFFCIIGGLLVAPRKGVGFGPSLLATWIGGPIGLWWLLSMPDED